MFMPIYSLNFTHLRVSNSFPTLIIFVFGSRAPRKYLKLTYVQVRQRNGRL